MQHSLKRDICSLKNRSVRAQDLNKARIQSSIPEYLHQASQAWIPQLIHGRSIFLLDDYLQDFVSQFLQTSFFYWLEVLSLINGVSMGVTNLCDFTTVVGQSKVSFIFYNTEETACVLN
jgi:hypothetical protein